MKKYGHKALTSIDVTSGKDLYQYYRGGWRFFGLRNKTDNHIVPTYIVERADDGYTAFTCGHPSIPNSGHKLITWDHIGRYGIFGTPLIGNHPFGSSYLVLTKIAVRESNKGLGLNESVKTSMPDPIGFGLSNLCHVLKLSARRTNLEVPPFDFFRSWNNGQQLAAEVADHIYNPVFSSVEQALTTMLTGDALGVPLNHKLGFHYIRKDPRIRLLMGMESIGTVVDESPRHPVIQIDEDRHDLLRMYVQDQFENDARII